MWGRLELPEWNFKVDQRMHFVNETFLSNDHHKSSCCGMHWQAGKGSREGTPINPFQRGHGHSSWDAAKKPGTRFGRWTEEAEDEIRSSATDPGKGGWRTEVTQFWPTHRHSMTCFLWTAIFVLVHTRKDSFLSIPFVFCHHIAMLLHLPQVQQVMRYYLNLTLPLFLLLLLFRSIETIDGLVRLVSYFADLI